MESESIAININETESEQYFEGELVDWSERDQLEEIHGRINRETIYNIKTGPVKGIINISKSDEPLELIQEKLSRIDLIKQNHTFNFFFTDQLISFITEETQRYAEFKNIENCSNITLDEMWNYIFIHIYSSVIRMPELSMLWSISDYYSTIISSVMTLKRFKRFRKLFMSHKYNKVPLSHLKIKG